MRYYLFNLLIVWKTELNSDLAECKFRGNQRKYKVAERKRGYNLFLLVVDEEIRANQEKLNFKLDHRRVTP